MRLVFAFALALCALSLKTAGAATDAPAHKPVRLLDAPVPADGRLLVRIGLAITNLTEVDEAHERFHVNGFAIAFWEDPRLAFSPRPGEKSRLYSQDQIWTPGFQLLNSSAPLTMLPTIRVSPDGEVQYATRFAATLSTRLGLRRFPFDYQDLQILVSPFTSGALNIDLKADKQLTQLIQSPILELEQWRLFGISSYEHRISIGDIFYLDQIEFRIHVQRRSMFYVWTIILPLIVMLLVAWSTLWIAPSHFAQQISITMPTFISVIAFSYAMAFTLPRVPYLTFMNAFFLSVYLFVFLSVLEIVAMYSLRHSGKEPLALAMHRKARWLLPLSYLTVVGAIIALFFG
jgi:hypothetical protein